jgi:predicted transglutaminase-like cysteine proteinase
MFRWLKLLFFNPKTIDELTAKCKTPSDISTWMWNHITYKTDKAKHGVKEYWQTAEETFNSRSGDCEDFSVLAKKVLDSHGFLCYILCVWGLKNGDVQGHAVCAVYWKNRWYHVSNWGCKRTSAKKLSGVPKSVYARRISWKVTNEKGKMIPFPKDI